MQFLDSLISREYTYKLTTTMFPRVVQLLQKRFGRNAQILMKVPNVAWK